MKEKVVMILKRFGYLNEIYIERKKKRWGMAFARG